MYTTSIEYLNSLIISQHTVRNKDVSATGFNTIVDSFNGNIIRAQTMASKFIFTWFAQVIYFQFRVYGHVALNKAIANNINNGYNFKRGL